MLQARPASAGGMLPTQGQSSSQYNASQPRSTYYGNPNTMGGGPVVYRTASAPIQPYAFTSTPSLNTNQNPRQQQPQQQSGNSRQSPSLPQLPRMKSFDSSFNLSTFSNRQQAGSSMINPPSGSSASVPRHVSRDDSSLPGQSQGQGVRRVTAATRPQSAYMAGASPQISFTQSSSTSRVPPDRYRRPSAPRSASDTTQKAASAAPSGSGMASIGHLYAADQQNSRRDSDTTRPASSTDDTSLYRKQSNDVAKRTRRRSLPSLDAADHTLPEGVALSNGPLATQTQVAHHRVGSTESSRSSLSNSSRPSSTNRSASNPTVSTMNPASITATTADKEASDKNKAALKLVTIPPRGSSDAANRFGNSSLLSTPVTMDAAVEDEARPAVTAGTANSDPKLGVPVSKNSTNRSEDDTASISSKLTATPSHLESPAMRHLSAINQKGGRTRSKTSRLRRAFSFGSAAEFHKAAGHQEEARDISPIPPVVTPNRLQKEPTSDELYDAEQARIAQQQEEAGIGNSIYANARIFTGSNDNVSISSTASSASIMIRKMGRGMKKTSRSLAGLFRPKSVVGVPASDTMVSEKSLSSTPPGAAVEATVSMVTVEAERELVNVTPDVHAQHAGGTGFPRLERNSLDASRASTASDRLSSSGTDNSGARRSIVGSEKERAEVLAAVRKGILKNTSGLPSLSSSVTLVDMRNRPSITDSPASSAPSTPNDEMQGQRRGGSVAISGEDYFISALRLRHDTRSGSSTPQGSMRRSATFSPRIVFHDTWPSQEYDRRGEIATCNRLTPMMAQQIKEELNSFKMEMEVHETSKIYTHFF